jgi:hypothetical protein
MMGAAISTAALGPIHGVVRFFDQFPQVCPVVGPLGGIGFHRGQTNADGDVDATLASGKKMVGNGLAETFRNLSAFGSSRLWECADEFFATESSPDIRLTQGAAAEIGQCVNDFVTDFVAELVVNSLEMVYVELQ